MFWGTFTIWQICRTFARHNFMQWHFKNWSPNNPSVNCNLPHLQNYYTCPLKYLFDASPFLAAALMIVVFLEISANWFLVWLPLSVFQDVSWTFNSYASLLASPPLFLVLLLQLLPQERRGGMEMENWSEILVDKDVLQNPVCWLSLTGARSCRCIICNRRDYMYNYFTSKRVPKPNNQPVWCCEKSNNTNEMAS